MKRVLSYITAAFKDDLFKILTIVLSLKAAWFSHITWIGPDSFFPAFGAVLIALAPLLLLKGNRIRLVYAISIDVVFSLDLFSQALYFKYFNDFASFYNLVYIGQLAHVPGAVFSLIGLKQALFVLDLIAFPFIAIRLKKARVSTASGPGRPRAAVFTAMLLLGLFFNTAAMTVDMRLHANFLGAMFDRRVVSSQIGVINYELMDFYSYITAEAGRMNVSKSDLATVTGWMNGKKQDHDKSFLAGAGKGMDLILLQVESMQNFAIGLKFHGQEITPNLNRLAEKGVVFTNFYDETAAGNSSDATFLANASLYPAKEGVAAFRYADDLFDSLPKALEANGYKTAVMEPYNKNYWNYDTFDRALGFQRQYYEDELRGVKKGPMMQDNPFFARALQLLPGIGVPFYAMLRTVSSHSPFTYVTKEMDAFPLYELEGSRIGNYLRSIHYADAAIGEFLDGLEKQGLLDKTVIIVYGDHRARLTAAELKSAGVADMAELRKIPLIIYVPHLKHTGKNAIVESTAGGLVDVAPTACSILGISTRDRHFMGRDLGEGGPGYAVFRDGSYLPEDGNFDSVSARRQLAISDLILGKDMMRVMQKAGVR